MTKYNDKFYHEFKVRDYECDIQGVVNNANYQHYLEHARHEYLLTKGINFIKFHDEGIDLIVTRVEIDYKYPLRGGDKFIVTVEIQREGNIRLIFNQNILRIPDYKLIVEAKVTGVATRKGRPIAPPNDILMQLELE
jgi:acyl-CoA thioester hydrolase